MGLLLGYVGTDLHQDDPARTSHCMAEIKTYLTAVASPTQFVALSIFSHFPHVPTVPTCQGELDFWKVFQSKFGRGGQGMTITNLAPFLVDWLVSGQVYMGFL